MTDTTPGAPTGTLDQQIARINDDLERIAAHLVPLLKNSYEQTLQRLSRAERVIATRGERPAIAGMFELLCSLRRLGPDEDVPAFIDDGLVNLLSGLGYREFGQVGDPYDPLRHEAIGGQTSRGAGRITRVHRRGLDCYEDVVIRATVEVEPDPANGAGPVDGTGSKQHINIPDDPNEGGI
jgi:molecular chaperone GrpE